jgi:putative transposase
LIERTHRRIAINRQCDLIDLSRSSFYYRKNEPGSDEAAVMRQIDETYTKYPFYGVRRITDALKRLGRCINHKRVGRLMRLMGLEAIYPKPRLSMPCKEHRKYPYLLRNQSITRPDQVWSTDITYIRLRHGFVYLAAIMDWFSRYVVSWALSITLDADFCVDMLKNALQITQPKIFNSDQGVQFTSEAFTGTLEDHCIRISMDGRGRAFDNIFVERLWRSVKYEEVYLKDYSGVRDAKDSLRRYFDFYNNVRPHQSLGYKTPSEIYYGEKEKHAGLTGGRSLISSSAPITNSMLSHKYLQGAPSGQTQGELHLKL